MAGRQDTSTGWIRDRKERRILDDLSGVLHSLAPLAKCGSDLIAIGEAWEAVELILEGEEFDVNVGVLVGFRRGDATFSEGRFLCFRIDREGIVLDELSTSYEAGIGSDHDTVPHTILRPGEHFDGYAVAQWVEAVDEMRQEDGVVLTTQRDHV